MSSSAGGGGEDPEQQRQRQPTGTATAAVDADAAVDGDGGGSADESASSPPASPTVGPAMAASPAAVPVSPAAPNRAEGEVQVSGASSFELSDDDDVDGWLDEAVRAGVVPPLPLVVPAPPPSPPASSPPLSPPRPTATTTAATTPVGGPADADESRTAASDADATGATATDATTTTTTATANAAASTASPVPVGVAAARPADDAIKRSKPQPLSQQQPRSSPAPVPKARPPDRPPAAAVPAAAAAAAAAVPIRTSAGASAAHRSARSTSASAVGTPAPPQSQPAAAGAQDFWSDLQTTVSSTLHPALEDTRNALDVGVVRPARVAVKNFFYTTEERASGGARVHSAHGGRGGRTTPARQPSSGSGGGGGSGRSRRVRGDGSPGPSPTQRQQQRPTMRSQRIFREASSVEVRAQQAALAPVRAGSDVPGAATAAASSGVPATAAAAGGMPRSASAGTLRAISRAASPPPPPPPLATGTPGSRAGAPKGTPTRPRRRRAGAGTGGVGRYKSLSIDAADDDDDDENDHRAADDDRGIAGVDTAAGGAVGSAGGAAADAAAAVDARGNVAADAVAAGAAGAAAVVGAPFPPGSLPSPSPATAAPVEAGAGGAVGRPRGPDGRSAAALGGPSGGAEPNHRPRPQRRQHQRLRQQQPTLPPNPRSSDLDDLDDDPRLVERFWRLYDDHVILSLFAIVGITFRILASSWFRIFDDAFNENSALFTNLPLNCLSCFLMGLLCSGRDAMRVVYARLPGFAGGGGGGDASRRRRRDGGGASYDHKKTDGDGDGGGVGAAAVVPGERQRGGIDTGGGGINGHENEFAFRGSGGDGRAADAYVERGGRPPAPAPGADGPAGSTQQQELEIDTFLSPSSPASLRSRLRRHARGALLEIVTGGTPRGGGGGAGGGGGDANDGGDDEDEMREVQLLGLERRISLSKSLVLFPGRKEEEDVLCHYFDSGRAYERDEDDDEGDDGYYDGDDSYHGSGLDVGGGARSFDSGASLSSVGRRTRQAHAGSSRSTEDGDRHREQQRRRQQLEQPGGSALTESGCSTGQAEAEAGGGRRRRLDPADGNGGGTRASCIGGSGATNTAPPTDDGGNGATAAAVAADTAVAVVGPAAPPAQQQQPAADPGPPPAAEAHRRSDEEAGAGYADGEHHQPDLDQIFNEMTEGLTRLARVNIADGWDVGTTPESMADDLLLGLRVGFCGCLSTFSSWNSSMINLLWSGRVTQALVGYAIGLQLPIVSYRFGQHVAVYVFVWRCRREARRDERRGGYGLRLNRTDDDDDDDDDDVGEEQECGYDEDYDGGHERMRENDDAFHDEEGCVEANFDGTPTAPIADGGGGGGRGPRLGSPASSMHGGTPRVPRRGRRRRRPRKKRGRILLDQAAAERETPSVRAIATAIFLLTVVVLINSLFFLDDPETSISLLFSPLGVLARWRLMKYNDLRPGFPLGTFACNMLGCALSGSLGSLLAGNPGPEESVVLQSMIQGFAGSLSSLAAFVVELLSLIDPIMLKWDGIRYAVLTLSWGLVVGFITSQAKDWADEI